jgi:hypothetical protein
MSPRHGQPVERADDGCQPLEGLGLELVVELALQRRREVLEDRRQVGDLLEQPPAPGPLDEQPEERQVLQDLRLGRRPLHLDHHPLPARERGPVHLADRPGGQRGDLEAREDVLPRDTELLLEHLRDGGLIERGDVVLQPGQLPHQLRRDQVGPRREQLAELRERRAELLERLAHGRGPGRQVGGLRARPQPVPGEHPADPGGPAQELAVGLRRDGGRSRAASAVLADQEDAAAGGVRNPVGHAVQEEPGAVAHAAARDHDQVGLLARRHLHRAGRGIAFRQPDDPGAVGGGPLGQLGLGAVGRDGDQVGARPRRNFGGPGQGLVARRHVLGDGQDAPKRRSRRGHG